MSDIAFAFGHYNDIVTLYSSQCQNGQLALRELKELNS